MKKLIPILIALSIFGCKARKVSLVKTDSVVTTASKSAVHTETNRRDTSTTKTETHTKTTDTSSSTVTIVPDTGSAVTFSAINGVVTFNGKAKSIVYKQKTGIDANAIVFGSYISGSATKIVKDSTGQSQTKTGVHKKVKDTESKPDYSWIWWVIGGIIILGAVYWVYRKFF